MTQELVKSILIKMKPEQLAVKMGISKEKVMLWKHNKRQADEADLRWLKDIAKELK